MDLLNNEKKPFTGISRWAKPAEFETGKHIEVVSFHGYTVSEITQKDGREPLYKPIGGDLIYRLEFMDGQKQRQLDINYKDFYNDMCGRIKAKGQRGTLKREVKGQTQKGRPIYKWTFIEDDKETVKEPGTTSNHDEFPW